MIPNWMDTITCTEFKVDGDDEIFLSYEEAEEVAEIIAIARASKPPYNRVDVDITGFLSDPADSKPEWYYVNRVTAEMKITIGDEDE